MNNLEYRIKHDLESVLELADPRERISAYHDMPYALFRYDPEEEFELRKQVTLLDTRLTQKGKRIKRIGDCILRTTLDGVAGTAHTANIRLKSLFPL